MTIMDKFEFPFWGERKVLNDDTRAGLPGDFVELADGVTHYELGGPENGDVVVLVHGFSVPYFIWDPTFAALAAAGFRVLRFDLYGRGYSDRPLKRYDHDLFDRQLAGLLDALGFHDPVDLVGLSMGGVVTGTFTRRHPQQVKKLVLIDPAGFPLKFSWVFKFAFLPGLGEFLFNLVGTANLETSMASDFYDPKLIRFFFDKYRPPMLYKGFKRAILSSLRAGMLDSAIETYRAVGKMNLPVLLFWGREDKTVPFKFHRDLLDAIPHIEFFPIDKTGHIPHYEKEEEVNPVLIDFLKRP